MDELLPYEEQLAGKLANLPLPDEDKGWDAMRKMLEEDDDDGGIIPPVNRGCRTWAGLLLLIALVAGIITLTWKRNTGHQTDNPHNPITLKDSSLAGKNSEATDTVTIAGNIPHGNAAADTVKQLNKAEQPLIDTTIPQQSVDKHFVKDTYAGKHTKANSAKKPQQQKDNGAGKTHPTSSLVNDVAQPSTSANVTADTVVKEPAYTAGVVPVNNNNNKPGADTIKRVDTPGKPAVTLTDTLQKNSGNKKKRAGENGGDEDNRVWFGAGLALQQLIPVDGQKAVPYSSSGRKGSLGDYIPSAYFRVYHKRKFLQVEFKYGAPQYTKDVAYQKTVISSDSSSGISVANVNHVKKTYYHQLPVSIHYTPLPNFSIGAGIIWNKFQSAVVEQQTRSFLGNAIIDSSNVTPGKLLTLKGDSATSFSKSYLQLMFEAQYTWRRFSLGARYAFGLQPYLTFTSPTTGQQQKERNASLNIFIRYELWRSKKK